MLGEKLSIWDLGGIGVIIGLFLLNKNDKNYNMKTNYIKEITIIHDKKSKI